MLTAVWSVEAVVALPDKEPLNVVVVKVLVDGLNFKVEFAFASTLPVVLLTNKGKKSDEEELSVDTDKLDSVDVIHSGAVPSELTAKISPAVPILNLVSEFCEEQYNKSPTEYVSIPVPPCVTDIVSVGFNI